MTFSDSHFEEMEEQGQINLFDIVEERQSKPVDRFAGGSLVRITNLNNLPEEDEDYYREYRKHIINTKGIVLSTKELNNGQMQYRVDFNGHIEVCYHHELEAL